MTAQRTKDWNEFAAKMADHIENYTVPQYGDAPNDNVWRGRRKTVSHRFRNTPHVLVVTNAPAKKHSTS